MKFATQRVAAPAPAPEPPTEVERVAVELIEGHGLGWHIAHAVAHLLFAGVEKNRAEMLHDLHIAQSVLGRLLARWDHVPATHGRRRGGYSSFTACGRLGIVSKPIGEALYHLCDSSPRRSDVTVAKETIEAEIKRLGGAT